MGPTMTEGKEWKLILFFTLPIIAGNLLQQLYSTVDGIIVGNIVGENALAAVGTTNPLTMLFIAIAMGMSTGASIAVSQFFGAQQLNEMRKCVSTSIIVHIALGLIFAVLGLVGGRWMLSAILGVQDYLLDDATLYIRIYSVGLIFQFIYNIVSSILRSLGDSKATLVFLVISSVANVVLDLFAVIVLQWGVAGVAWATVAAQALSCVISVVYMYRKHPVVKMESEGEKTYYDKDMAALIVKIGLPVVVQQCVVSFGHIFTQRVINAFDVTAGYTAGIRVENFIVAPISGFFLGMSTFTGQNLGAQKLDRVKQGLKSALGMVTIFVVIIGVVVFVFAPALISIFNVTEVFNVEIGVTYLRWVAVGFILFSWYMTFNGVLQGAGDVGFTLFNSFTGLALKTIAIYLIAFLTPVGIYCLWWCQVASWLYSLILAAVRYKMGPWKKKGVVAAEPGPVEAAPPAEGESELEKAAKILEESGAE